MKKLDIYLFSYSQSQKVCGLVNMRTAKVSYNRKYDNIKDAINGVTRDIMIDVAWSNAVESCFNITK